MNTLISQTGFFSSSSSEESFAYLSIIIAHFVNSLFFLFLCLCSLLPELDNENTVKLFDFLSSLSHECIHSVIHNDSFDIAKLLAQFA